jgi:uncharacterized membrane protein YqjE
MAENGQHGELRDQSTGDLFRQLSQQTSDLVRQEVDLAKAELSEKGKKAGIGAGMFGGAGLMGLGAFGALTTCLILALAIVLDAWLAALIVAVVYGAIAGVLALQGRDRVREAAPAAPEQTVETVKEDIEWAKSQAKSARR